MPLSRMESPSHAWNQDENRAYESERRRSSRRGRCYCKAVGALESLGATELPYIDVDLDV